MGQAPRRSSRLLPAPPICLAHLGLQGRRRPRSRGRHPVGPQHRRGLPPFRPRTWLGGGRVQGVAARPPPARDPRDRLIMAPASATIAAMLDHEEKFLFKEEILHLSNAVAEPGVLDNVEDLLTDVITSPRFDSEVFTLERSLQVMLGPRAGTTLVGLLTVAPEVFDEVAEVRIPSEVHERLVAWRARFGLAIDNALNFLNNPDGIQGHNFATQIAHVEERRVLQGRLTLVRYNNEPQFFVADASVFLS